MLRHRDEIVSLGLLPIIATLVGLHFLPTLLTLGLGVAVSVAGQVYALTRHNALNLFLLQGTTAITLCFLIRLFTGENLLPDGSVTTTLEVTLLVLAFLHITTGDLYQHVQRRLHLKCRSTYRLETAIIVTLSSLHLLTVALLHHAGMLEGAAASYFIVYIPPIAIYIICFTVNAIGLRLALDDSITRGVIRIAPVRDGQICLKKQSDLTYDLPIEQDAEGTPESVRHIAVQLMSRHAGNHSIKPRLILRHRVNDSLGAKLIELYIYPHRSKDDFKAEDSRFFSFDEIRRDKAQFSKTLLHELPSLEMAAQMWQQYFKDNDSTCQSK